MKCKIYLFVAILENGRHIGFLIGQSYRMDLITIEMSHAKFVIVSQFARFTPKMHNICSTESVTTCPKDNVTIVQSEEGVSVHPPEINF